MRYGLLILSFVYSDPFYVNLIFNFRNTISSLQIFFGGIVEIQPTRCESLETIIDAKLLKLDKKKTSVGLGIYYISYVTKKPEYEINSVNPLYLMINRIDGLTEEKNGDKYLNIASTDRNSAVLKT